MNDKVSTLCMLAKEQGIAIARITRLIENVNATAYEPEWYINVVVFEALTIKRIGVHRNRNGELYLKPSQDLSLIRHGGDAMDSVSMNVLVKEEIIKLVEKEISSEPTHKGELVVRDEPYIKPHGGY